MSPSTPRLPLALALALALYAAGCSSPSTYSVGPQERGSTSARSGYYAVTRVESIARGGGVKVNGFIASDLPGRVELETDETGKVVKQYVISLSTNILDPGENSRVTIEPGEYAPGRIYFDRSSVQVTENAIVRKRAE